MSRLWIVDAYGHKGDEKSPEQISWEREYADQVEAEMKAIEHLERIADAVRKAESEVARATFLINDADEMLKREPIGRKLEDERLANWQREAAKKKAFYTVIRDKYESIIADAEAKLEAYIKTGAIELNEINYDREDFGI